MKSRDEKLRLTQGMDIEPPELSDYENAGSEPSRTAGFMIIWEYGLFFFFAYSGPWKKNEGIGVKSFQIVVSNENTVRRLFT